MQEKHLHRKPQACRRVYERSEDPEPGFVRGIGMRISGMSLGMERDSCRKGVVEMDFLSQYIVVVVLAICLCIGYIIKHSISFIPNKFIPLIVAVVGIVLNVWINGWTFTPEILLGGLASGLASTGTFEMVRNIMNGREAAQVSSPEMQEVKR